MEHDTVRANGGFSVVEMLAEFRALRASVLRRWTAEHDVLMRVHIADLGAVS